MVMSSEMMKYTPEEAQPHSKGPRTGKHYIPPVHIDDIPSFSFKELLEMSRFNPMDQMDIHVDERYGTKFMYIGNLLENPLDLRNLMTKFPAERKQDSALEADDLNGGKSFSGSKAPGMQQPIERQLMPAFGNELFFLAKRLNFLKFKREAVTWKYFTNCFYPKMQSFNKNYLPHMDPFSYAANVFLTESEDSGTTFFRVHCPIDDKWYYNMNDFMAPSATKSGARRWYVDQVKERYGYNEKGDPKQPIVQPIESGIEDWVYYQGDDFYDGYLHLPARFNTMSFYRGSRWHSATFDAANAETTRYSLVGVIE